jgi:hypothetical protein
MKMEISGLFSALKQLLAGIGFTTSGDDETNR